MIATKLGILLLACNISLQALGSDSCSPPKGGQPIYTCEKLISSEIVGRAQDKISTAKYKIWLQDEALCIDGRNSSGSSVEPGKGQFTGTLFDKV